MEIYRFVSNLHFRSTVSSQNADGTLYRFVSLSGVFNSS